MNPQLSRLQPYPFERVRQLFAGVTPSPAHRPISLGMGEPKHPTPEFIKQALTAALHDPSTDLAGYPPTAGSPKLREAFAGWLQRRYGLAVDPATQVLPVNGSREALFAFAQTVIDPRRPPGRPKAGDAPSGGSEPHEVGSVGATSRSPPGRPKASDAPSGGSEPHEVGSVGATSGPVVVCPNPFYQIYEGAALLAGAEPFYAPSDPARNFAVDWDSVPAAVWARTQLLFVCSPGNPTGAVMPLAEWRKLFELSDRHGFVIASDECYSEIYFSGEPPLGGLEAAARLGRTDFRNLVSFTSLSKRSNVPGLRSGFVAGDARLIQQFLLYRTYHGSAMSPVVQAASIAAWGDEQHVVENRALYRAKFAEVTPIVASVLDVQLPDAGFYLWANVGESDTAFARDLLAQYNVTVLPGSYLARDSAGLNPGNGEAPGNNPENGEAPGNNPGRNRIRMALVAATPECVEAAQRIVQFVKDRSK